MHPAKERAIIRLLVLIIMITCASPLVIGQTLEAKLTQNVTAFDSESSSTIDQLIAFARQFQIPMGIEWLQTTKEKPARPIHVNNASAQYVLHAILQQQPGYQYTKSDGIIHVFASSLIGDRRNFLELRVPKFKVEAENLFGAEYKLRISIQQVLHPSSGSGGGYGGVGLKNDFDVRKITFSGTDLTVRQILNKIAAAQGNALWVVGLKQGQMMDNARFYAQTLSPTTTEAAADFHWKFMPLKENK
jgi:hypothetical protein